MRWIAILGLFTCLLAPVARAEMRPPPFSQLDAAGFGDLKAAYLEARKRGHEPRTEQRDATGAPLYLNRLITERAPYLLQHAHNPVDWRPWGQAALAEAQALGRPIFLSVGYAACHWCHVMEAESFDHPETAALLNSAFVPVKVDRETLPAIDAAYMRATEIISGVGGWPNTLWLTPEGAPIFARTYLPRADLRMAAETIAAGWAEDKAGLRALAGRVMDAMEARAAQASAAQSIDWTRAREAAADALLARHNALSGGFSQVAQFPLAPSLRFLIDHWRRTGAPDALEAALTTLDHIAAAGLTDHVGGGFHRYTVDPNWAVPHFEKMLYTQAQLARVMVEAWEITRRPAYRRAAERALDYVLRDMTSPDGGFYAAEDADSAAVPGGERVEGAFYAWTLEEMSALLGDEKAAELAQLFSLDLPPMIEAGATMRAETDALDTLARFDDAFAQMRERRAQRPRPFRDEKVIAGWNGLMIEALSAAAIAFQRPDYLTAARRSAALIETHLWTLEDAGSVQGRLYRYLIAGEPAKAPAALNDYAYVALGFVALADASGEARWLELAGAVTSAALVRFRTDDGRLALDETPTPLGRTLEGEDDILPTGESALIEALARLSRREAGYMAEDDSRAALVSAAPAIDDPADGRVVALIASAILEKGESENRRALAHGVVRATLQVEEDQARVALSIAPGWHVNAHRPYDDMLVPTHLEGAGIGSVDYPKPHDVDLGFSDKPLSVIEGEAEIRAVIAADPQAPVELTLTIQTCSTEICLEPQRAVFRVLAHAGD